MNFSYTEWDPKLLFVLVWAFVFLLFSVGKLVLWRFFEGIARNTNTHWDDLLLRVSSPPARFFCIIAGFVVALRVGPEQWKIDVAIIAGTRIAFVLCVSWLAVRLLEALPDMRKIQFFSSETTLTLYRIVLRTILFTITFVIIIDTLGISITPILASLGVGSLAVALALQDTLGNLFSGFYILVDQPVRVGDFVKTDFGTEGIIKKVGWRSTQIELLSNNTVVVPNSKLATSVVTNFNMPDQETAVPVELGVAYESDLEKVERITLEVARDVLSRVQGGVRHFEPTLRFHTFADSSINFKVVLRSIRYADSFFLRHEFMKAVQKRFAQENISIPFPQRVLHMSPTKNLV